MNGLNNIMNNDDYIMMMNKIIMKVDDYQEEKYYR